AGSVAMGYSQRGDVIGTSFNVNDVSTAVIWPTGSGTATPVSNLDDNCTPVSVNNTLVNGLPSVALDCPNPSVKGTVIPEIAQNNALLGGYTKTQLQIPTGYDYCTVSEINDALNSIGSCHTAGPDHPVSA
ncbi:TPA: hypothetical protein QDC03_007645, partial [Burkholderia cepacia]|nr:hypothetical protein [Burkholderia cepacia]